MDPTEQKQFVNELIEKIDHSNIPESWDGFELRQYIADKFNDAVFISMDRSRKKEYNNTVLVNNL